MQRTLGLLFDTAGDFVSVQRSILQNAEYGELSCATLDSGLDHAAPLYRILIYKKMSFVN